MFQNLTYYTDCYIYVLIFNNTVRHAIMKKTAIIVKGEWTRNDTIVFVAKKGYYPCDYSGDIDGFFVAEEVVEQGETPVINDEEEVTFFKNKYSQFVERVDVQID